MDCSIVINQQVSSLDPESKIKDSKHVETTCKSRENYTKKN